VQQGETRQVRVLEVDEQERKMRLSLKPAEGSQSAEGQQASDQAQAGQGAAEGKQAGKKPQGKAKQRKKPENLRGGMDPGGVGLGGLRPEDFK
jgi:ribosomal protein S1